MILSFAGYILYFPCFMYYVLVVLVVCLFFVFMVLMSCVCNYMCYLRGVINDNDNIT